VIGFLSSEIPDANLAVHLFRTRGRDRRLSEKVPIRKLHRLFGIRQIANPGDKKSGTFQSDIPRRNQTVHLLGHVEAIKAIREKSRQEKVIGISGFERPRGRTFKSRNREESTRPSICWDAWQRSKQSGKSRKETRHR
jgi:hypothetical protein